MTEGWAKAVQSFQTMYMGAAGAGLPASGQKMPYVHFAPEKLQALQQQYMQEAMGLFNTGMKAVDADPSFLPHPHRPYFGEAPKHIFADEEAIVDFGVGKNCTVLDQFFSCPLKEILQKSRPCVPGVSPAGHH